MTNENNTNTKEIDVKKKKHSKVKKLLIMAAIDLVLAGVFLIVYAYFHHVAPIRHEEESIAIQKPSAEVTEQIDESDEADKVDVDDETTADADEQPEEEADRGPLYEKFKDKFTDGEIIITENSYVSDTIHITINKVEENMVTYYVTDVYLTDIEDFKTGFSEGEYGPGTRDRTLNILKDYNGIVGISGDYYGLRISGLVIRNGVLYRKSVEEDVLVLYYDGSMETIKSYDVKIDELLDKGAYQSWSFGPILLEDGEPVTLFRTTINGRNPRSAIGYYEPGHYCLVVVDGRQDNYSIGVSLKELAQIFYDLGCTEAYNLDGGQTAVMAFCDEIVSQPINGGRFVSDIVYIGERTDCIMDEDTLDDDAYDEE